MTEIPEDFVPSKIDDTDANEEVIENSEAQINYVERNLFYANDALKPPPPDASDIDKKKYQQIRQSVKRLRRLEKNPLFQIQMMDLKKQMKDESNDG